MNAWIVERLWRASWQAGLLALAVLLLQWLLARWLTPAWRHRLWWLVLLRLALPVLPESPLSAFNWLAPRPLPLVAPAAKAVPIAPALPAITMTPPVANPLPMVDAPPAPALTPRAPAVNSAPTPEKIVPAAPVRRPVPWQTWAVLIWLVGAGGLAARLAWQWLRFRGQLRAEHLPVSPEILAAATEARQALGVRRPVDLCSTTLIRSPAVCGLWRPCLLVPADLASGFDAAELRHLLLHEFAHIRRGDLLENALATALQMAHWFNPLAWLAFARLRADRELACDARALAAAREADPRAYGRSLLKWVERCAAPAPHPGLVGLLEDPGQMRRRFRQIAHYGRARRWPALAGVLFAAVGVLALTDAQAPKPAKPLTKPPATIEEALAQADKENRSIAALTNEVHQLSQEAKVLFREEKLEKARVKLQKAQAIQRQVEALKEQYGKGRQVVVYFSYNPGIRANAPTPNMLIQLPRGDESSLPRHNASRLPGFWAPSDGMFTIASSPIIGLEVSKAVAPEFSNEKEAADLLRRLLASEIGYTSKTYLWNGYLPDLPSISARVIHSDRSQGQWLLWALPAPQPVPTMPFLSSSRLPSRFFSAYRDGKGVWWLSDLYDDLRLEQKFASTDSAVRLRAVKEAFFDSAMARTTLPSLLKMLNKDPDLNLRRYLASALGERNDFNALRGDALETALRQSDVEVRQKAAESLGKITDQYYRATPALVGVLNDPAPEVRHAAAEALRQIAARTRDTNALPELVAAANASDPQVRTAAQSILKTVGTNAPPSDPPSSPPSAPSIPDGPVSKAAPIEPANAYFPLVSESISLNPPNCQRGLENVLGLSLDNLDEPATARAQSGLRQFFTAATGVDFLDDAKVPRSENSVEALSRKLMFDLAKKDLIVRALPEEITLVGSVLSQFGTTPAAEVLNSKTNPTPSIFLKEPRKILPLHLRRVVMRAELLQIPREDGVITGVTPEESRAVAPLVPTNGTLSPLLVLSPTQYRAIQQVLLRRPGAKIVGQATLAQASNWRTQITLNKLDPDAESPLDSIRRDYALRLLPVVRSNGCLAMLELDVFHTPPGQTDSVQVLHAPTNIAFFEGQTLLLSRPWPKEMPNLPTHENIQYYLFLTAQSLGEAPMTGELEPSAPRSETAPVARPDAKPSTDSVNQLVQAGRQLLEAGRLDEAEAKLEQAFKADPNYVAARYYLNLVSEIQAQQKNRVAQPEMIARGVYPSLPPTRSTGRRAADYKVLHIDPTALLDWGREHHPELILPNAKLTNNDQQLFTTAQTFLNETVGESEAVEEINFINSGLSNKAQPVASPPNRVDDQASHPRLSYYLKWKDWGGESSAVPYGTKANVPVHLRAHVGLLYVHATPEQLAKLEAALAGLQANRQIQLRATWIDAGTAHGWGASSSRSYAQVNIYELPKGSLTMDVFGWSVPVKPTVVWFHAGAAGVGSQAWFQFILTPEQARETVLHYEEATGADVLKGPPVIARNGQTAPLLVDPTGSVGKFKVRPTLAPDGYAIDLAVEAELPDKSAPGNGGNPPHFTTRLAVWDSQSAVLACALPGAIPAGETQPQFKPRRYLFLTARVLGQDGQPLRSDDGLPTRVLYSAPPQPEPVKAIPPSAETVTNQAFNADYISLMQWAENRKKDAKLTPQYPSDSADELTAIVQRFLEEEARVDLSHNPPLNTNQPAAPLFHAVWRPPTPADELNIIHGNLWFGWEFGAQRTIGRPLHSQPRAWSYSPANCELRVNGTPSQLAQIQAALNRVNQH